MTTLEELRGTINNYRHQDMPLQSIKDDLNVLLDEVEMNGSQLQTQTATVTTDANTFVGSHVFDLLRLAVAEIRLTFLSSVGDGETFGDSPGDICVLFAHGESLDGVTFVGLSPLWSAFDNSDANANTHSAGQFEDRCVPTPRYIKVSAIIGDSDSNPYAGANNPTATVRFDVTYL